MNPLLPISCGAAVISDVLFVGWSKAESHPTAAAVAGLILLNLAAVLWMRAIRQGVEVSAAITLYSAGTIIGCSILGFAIFGEQLTLTKLIGIVLALIAITLVSL